MVWTDGRDGKDQQEKRLGKSLNTQNTFHFIAGLKNVFFMSFVALNASALLLSDYNVKNSSSNPSSKLYMADVLQEYFICHTGCPKKTSFSELL